MSFNGLYLTAADSTGVHAAIKSLELSDLPEGDVLIRVSHSSLNYKDALAVTKGAPVVRAFPMVPGIDVAGTVEESSDPRYAPGDPVLVNGWGLGEQRWGGHAQYCRVPGDFITRIPTGLSAAGVMAVGTAGYTAMLCLLALERAGLEPGAGPVLVTGAMGGVGSFAVSFLSARGYEVVASTGRGADSEYLRALGASSIINRHELSEPGKPLQKERWLAAVDSVGGHTLANVCASIRYRGWVAACGLAQSMDFPATVAPFILRNVSLFGIESVRAPQADREAAWARIATDLNRSRLEAIASTISLEEVVQASHDLLEGRVRGRLVVAL